jgi:molybdopterin-containing oxidoreductase family iron-sulfur binding subunit
MIHELNVLDEAGDRQSANGRDRRKTWRGLEDRESAPAYQQMVDGEFMPEATESPSRTSRRKFLEIMGASIAMAGMAACRKPVERIVPYTRMPESVVPGKSEYYATAYPISGSVRPVLVESHEGRPTKVEGNEEHPGSEGGGTGVYEQASVLNLYDPDRSRQVFRDGESASWEAFQQFVQEFNADADDRQIAVIAEPSSSPTRRAMRARLEEEYGQVHWVDYTPHVEEEAQRRGAQIAFGQPLRPEFRFSEADVVVSLDADFLGPSAVNHPENTREFADSRRIYSEDEEMSRLYVVESMFTVTGGRADNRLRLQSGQVPAFAAALAAALGIEEASSAGQEFADHPWIEAVADDLREHAGSSIILAGESQSPAVHAVCALINDRLGNSGQTVRWLDTGREEEVAELEQIEEVIGAIDAGEVDALLMLDTNPVYNLPPELNFSDALQAVPESIHLGLWRDETAQQSSWHLPRSYYLEAWGDGRSYSGVLSVIQPLIAPLYETRSEIELLNLLATGEEVGGYDLVREVWQTEIISENFDQLWRRTLHDGYLPDSEYPVVTPGETQPAADIFAAWPEVGAGDLELVFRTDPQLYDGRFANNAWMQEQPDPVTKITWDNVAVMSPATAEAFDLSVELHKGKHYVDIVELTHEGRSLELPVWVLPGHADDSITVMLGYGRNIASRREETPDPAIGIDSDIYNEGPLGNGVGANAYRLRGVDGRQVVRDVELNSVGENYMIASTQDHGNMHEREIVRWADMEEYRENPEFAPERAPDAPGDEPWEDYPTLWEESHPSDSERAEESIYADYQWGMVIDLNTCTGCGTCITACTSENNIPVVGKQQVSEGREMHWMRLDRYFTGDDPENPGMVMQAMLCMHCENAPCESVCPVAATSHSADGINEMTYNRCIGTRYCANNCPWKVRRFNFLNWTDEMPEQVKMAMNPNVSLRFRGVMEKCTYCVQRVREVGRAARNEDRDIRDGEVQTACQQACPAEAITFGDVSDPETEVSVLKANDRNYVTMAELGTRPRTSYLGQVNNPNPRLDEVSG